MNERLTEIMQPVFHFRRRLLNTEQGVKARRAAGCCVTTSLLPLQHTHTHTHPPSHHGHTHTHRLGSAQGGVGLTAVIGCEHMADHTHYIIRKAQRSPFSSILQ